MSVMYGACVRRLKMDGLYEFEREFPKFLVSFLYEYVYVAL